jgi:hypothetical protein
MECDKVRKLFSDIKFEQCCESCHEDDDRGYGDDLWFLAPDGKIYHVCCAVSRGLKETNE